MTVLVCGGRTFDNKKILFQVLDKINTKFGITEIVSGNCVGADALGESYAILNNIPLKIFPANWKSFGKSAGQIRNKQMVDYIKDKPSCVVACWGGESRGTKGTITFASKYNIPIYEVRYETESFQISMYEGISANGNSFTYDFENDNDYDIVNLTRRKIYSTRLLGNQYYYEYRFNDIVDKSVRDNFLKSLKMGDYNEFPHKNLIDDCVEDFYSAIEIPNNTFDTIIEIPSTKPIVNSIVSKLSAHNTVKLNKLKSVDVDFDYTKIQTNYDDNTKFFDYLKGIISYAQKDEVFSISKIPYRYRKYLTTTLQLPDNEVKIPVDGNILIVDDIISSGTTIQNAIKLLRDKGFVGNIYILSLFRNR